MSRGHLEQAPATGRSRVESGPLSCSVGVISALLCGALLGGLGCASMPPADLGLSRYLKGEQPEVTGATPVTFGDWTDDYLHCALERCDNFYWIDVTRSGDLRVEVYAPWGSGLPDFGVVLLDPMGKPIAAPTEPGARPARLNSRVSPGRYTVRVHATGSDDGRLGYELIASFEASGRPASSADKASSKQPATSVKRPTTTPKPSSGEPVKRPAPAPADDGYAAGSLVATAEVLDVEQENGEPVYVLLDAGEPQSVRVGMRGRLREGAETIGRIEIIEVYRDGSRAKLLDSLTGDITIDTGAEIFDAR